MEVLSFLHLPIKGDRYIYTKFISIDCELIIIGVTAVGATIDHEILAVTEVTIQLMQFDYFLSFVFSFVFSFVSFVFSPTFSHMNL